MLPGASAAFWDNKLFTVTVKDEAGRMVAVLTAIATLDPVQEAEFPPES